jgi:Domain of unknown function (DUF4249)
MIREIAKVLLISFLGICLFSCIDEIELPIRVEKPKLVVDGLITNEPGPYLVKLSFTGKYQNSLSTPANLALNGAKVTISDNRGRSSELRQDVLELGTYRTIDPNFRGNAGYTYKLEVLLPSGEKYATKPGVMQPVAPILNLSYEYKKVESLNTTDGYQVFVDTKDPANEQNFYRWSAYGFSRWESTGAICGAFSPILCYQYCWVPTDYPQVLLYSDASINGNVIKKYPVFLSPIRAIGNHFIEITQYSLSKDAYTFWSLYEEQRKRVGTIFDPQPAPIEGNLVNQTDPTDIALGYFSVSSVSKKKLTIPIEQNVRTNPSFIKLGDCRKAYINGTLDRPSGWE